MILLGCTLVRAGYELRNFARSGSRSDEEDSAGIRLAILVRKLKTIRADRVLGWAVLGNTYLFFLAALAAIHDRDLRPRRAAR